MRAAEPVVARCGDHHRPAQVDRARITRRRSEVPCMRQGANVKRRLINTMGLDAEERVDGFGLALGYRTPAVADGGGRCHGSDERGHRAVDLKRRGGGSADRLIRCAGPGESGEVDSSRGRRPSPASPGPAGMPQPLRVVDGDGRGSAVCRAAHHRLAPRLARLRRAVHRHVTDDREYVARISRSDDRFRCGRPERRSRMVTPPTRVDGDLAGRCDRPSGRY